MIFTSGARGGRADTLAPLNDILWASRMDDWDDPWGTGLSWLGAVCDILTIGGADEYLPERWAYSPSPYMTTETLTEYPASYILEDLGQERDALNLDLVAIEQLAFAGEVFHRILQLVPEADRY